jgi:triacylglycerol lipase
MPLQLFEDAFGDWRNANFLGFASDLAYLPEAVAAPKFQELLGMDARLISRDNTQCYVLTNAEHIVLAFRGTEAPTTIDGLKDWLLTDAMNLLIVPEGRLGTDFIAAGVSARFHQGFISALAEIWDPVDEAVAAELKASERPLWITGHSLGGALALLAGWLFVRKFVNVHQIITFGGPMIGNKDAVQAFDSGLKGKIFRYVDPRDPVPQLPTMSLVANEFYHCEQMMCLGEMAQGSFWKNLAVNSVGGVFTGGGVDAAWKHVMDCVGAHSMTTYLTYLKNRLNV